MAFGFVALLASPTDGSVGRMLALTPSRSSLLQEAGVPGGSHDLANLLPREVTDDVMAFMAEARPWFLVLDASLPLAWQSVRWEEMSFMGRRLDTLALVLRSARPLFAPSRVAESSGQGLAAWLNLFPRSEFLFSSVFATEIESQRLRRVLPTRLDCDPMAVADLFVLAHGNSRGLLDAEGHPFEITTSALPGRVWLLACNADQAMWRIAATLLEKGVRTVIAATGDLSAPQMAALVRAWLDRTPGQDLETWLMVQRESADGEGGARSLTVFGEVAIDRSEASCWNRVTWQHQLGEGNGALNFGIDDRERFVEALAVIDSPALWEESFQLLYPKLLAQAENFDHEQMVRLEPLHSRARPVPARDLALATAFYRKGQYRLMAQFIARGLRCDSVAEMVRAELLGLLTLLLIDMDLPDAAEDAANLHEQCDISDPKSAGSYALKRLDWRARIAFRRGRDDFPMAIQRMEAKRRGSVSDPSARELSWLLYMGAWDRHEHETRLTDARTDALVGEVLERLAGCDPWASYPGNEDPVYMLRALACHAALCSDTTVLGELQRWVPTLPSRLSAIDAGPWAFTVLYLGLIDFVPSELKRRALGALEDQGYFHEAAAFAMLMGEDNTRERNKGKFLSLRNQVLRELDGLDGILSNGRDWLAPPQAEWLSAIPM